MALKSGRINWNVYETDGVPSSGLKEPNKDDIRPWAKFVESFGFKTRAEFVASDIHADFSSILITGYYAEGDGGAQQFVRLASAPVPVEQWHVQTVDGSWWSPNIHEPYIEQFGAKPDSVSAGFDCSAAVAAALKYAGTGGKVRARAKLYCLAAQINQGAEGAAFEGSTSSQFIFGSEFSQGTVFKWTGALNGVMWAIGDLATAGSVSGPFIDKVTLWGNNLASIILLARNTDNLRIGDIKLSYPNPANSAAYGFFADSGSSSTGGFSGCNYNAIIDRMLIHVHGVANGARLTGKAAANGSNVTFLTAFSIHCVYQNGTAYEIFKADSLNILSLKGSRSGGNADGSANAGAPATGDFLRLGGSGDTSFYVVGNKFHFMHCGKTDGTDPVIRIRDTRVICNDLGMLSATDNGLQIVLENGAVEPVYHKMGDGYGSTLAGQAAYSSVNPLKIRAYETTKKDIINAFDNVQKTSFAPVLKINGSSAGITQTTTGRWQRTANGVKLWIKFTCSVIAGTGNVTLDWALGAGAPPAADALCDTFAAVRAVTGFVSGVADRPLGAVIAGNVITLLKQAAGGGGMSNLTQADITATVSGVIQIDYFCATAA